MQFSVDLQPNLIAGCLLLLHVAFCDVSWSLVGGRPPLGVGGADHKCNVGGYVGSTVR